MSAREFNEITGMSENFSLISLVGGIDDLSKKYAHTHPSLFIL